jgi:hypothetical protein
METSHSLPLLEIISSLRILLKAIRMWETVMEVISTAFPLISQKETVWTTTLLIRE